MSSVFIPQLSPLYCHKLYYFYYVAHFGSYSKAAKVLHVTQSSLSRAVKALEQRLNTILLVRSSRHVSLTPRGKNMIGDVDLILEKLKKIEEGSKESTIKDSESIIVSVEEPLLCDYLLKPLLKFQKSRPDLKLELRSMACLGPVPPAIHVISIGLGLEKNSNRIQKSLLGFESALYASQTYLQGLEPPLTLEDLSKHRLLLLNETIPGIFEDMNWHDSLLKKKTRQNSTRCMVHTSEHLFNMATAGFGIIAWVKGHPYLKANLLTEILEGVSRLYGPQSQAYFACENHSFKTEGVQALYLYLKEYCETFSKNG